MCTPCMLSLEEVVHLLVKLTATSSTCEAAAPKDDAELRFVEAAYQDHPICALRWGPRISCGALPPCLPVLGDSIAFIESPTTSNEVQVRLQAREQFSFYRRPPCYMLGFLHVSESSSWVVPQRAACCLEFSAHQSTCLSAPESKSRTHLFKSLGREVVSWILQVPARGTGRTRQAKISEIVAHFPFLMLLSPSQRADYVVQAIETYVPPGLIVWFDQTAIIQTGDISRLCPFRGTKAEQRGMAALRLALDRLSLIGDATKMEKLCHGLRVLLNTRLKHADAVLPPALLKSIAIVFQVMSPFLNASLKAAEGTFSPILLHQLDMVLDYCDSEELNKLSEFFDTGKKNQKRRREEGLRFLTAALQHTSRLDGSHGKAIPVHHLFSVSASSCLRPTQPWLDHVCAFFSSTASSPPPSDEATTTTNTTLVIDMHSLRSTRLDSSEKEEEKDQIRKAAPLPKINKLMEVKKRVLGELVLSIQFPSELLFRDFTKVEEKADLELFIGKRARVSTGAWFDEAESYALDIIRRKARARRQRNI